MERRINESFATASPPVECCECGRAVNYHDRLSDNTFVCLSCSYSLGLKPSQDCVVNGREFDPSDDGIRAEMMRISQIDIDRADKNICAVEIVIPEDLWGPLNDLMKANSTSLNAEIVSALGWYTTVCANRHPSALVDYTKYQPIRAESPELAEILGTDGSGIGTS